MIRHVPFEDVGERHLEWIVASCVAAPEAVRPSASDFLRALMLETMRLFEWDDGCVILGAREGRLVIWAFGCNKLTAPRTLREDLRRLATDWECDTIETTVFDTRLASAITKLGARVESITLTLGVD